MKTTDFVAETDRGINEVFKRRPPLQADADVFEPEILPEVETRATSGILNVLLVIGAYFLFCALYIALWLAM